MGRSAAGRMGYRVGCVDLAREELGGAAGLVAGAGQPSNLC